MANENPSIEIKSESDFRTQSGLPENVKIEWKEWHIVNSTPDVLNKLKKDISAQRQDVEEQKKIAEEFIRANDITQQNTVSEAKEKKGALDGLSDKLGSSILKNAKVLAAGTWIATGVALMANNLDKKFEESTGEKIGLLDSIRDWLKDSMNESDGFMKSVWAFFYKALGGDRDGKKEKTPEVAPKWVSKVDPTLQEAWRNTLDIVVVKNTSSFLINRAGEKEYHWFWSALGAATRDATWGKDEKDRKDQIEISAKTILWYNSIADKPVGLIIENKDKPNLDVIVGAKLSEQKEKFALQYAAKALAFDEEFINSALKWSKHQDWKKMPTWEFLKHFYEYTALGSLTAVSESIRKFDWAGWAEGIKKQMQWLLISKWEDGKMSGIIGEHLESLKGAGLDDEVLGRILVPWTEWEWTVVDYRTTLRNSPYTNSSAQKLMEKLTEKAGFSSGVSRMMTDIWLKDYSSKLNNGESLHMDELLSIYAVTWGETDITKLSLGQETQVMPLLYSIAARVDPAAVASDSLQWLISKSNNPHVERVSKFIWESISDATYFSVLNWLKVSEDVAKQFLKLRETNPKLFYWAIFSMLVLVVIAARLRGFFIKTAAMTTIITLSIEAATAMSASR